MYSVCSTVLVELLAQARATRQAAGSTISSLGSLDESLIKLKSKLKPGTIKLYEKKVFTNININM